VTEVALRAAVLLGVRSGVGLRGVWWLLKMLFHLEVSKSALERHVQDCAAQLPKLGEMAKALNADKPIKQVHMDEIFARGQRPKPCTVVLRDEHGRIFAIQELKERSAAAVAAFLAEVKGWGIDPVAFYVDGCEAYREAIQMVFPKAVIQYDYFHVIQNIFKKLWKSMLNHRRDVKKRAGETCDKNYGKRLVKLAEALWDGRYLLFKRDENLTAEEKVTLADICQQDSKSATLRGFQKALSAIFERSTNAQQAQELLADLRARPEVRRQGSAYAKAVKFLDSRFGDMVAYLRHPGVVQRNSLSETGIRFLRRLEQGHDGFRSPAGMDRHLRIFQAVRYLGWSVHTFDPGLGLPVSSAASAS
jgi:hypothetical protein